VAFDADPSTGVAMYDSYDYPSNPWLRDGGTSLATPCWAGLIAIADQMRVAMGRTTLNGASQTLPALYSLPSQDFHDITRGSNGGYTAGKGYDEVTGLGSPVANLLVPALAAYRKPNGLVTKAQRHDRSDAIHSQDSDGERIGRIDTSFHRLQCASDSSSGYAVVPSGLRGGRGTGGIARSGGSSFAGFRGGVTLNVSSPGARPSHDVRNLAEPGNRLI